MLIHTLKGLSLYAVEGRKVGVVDRDVNHFTVESLFSTLTNVNFDAARFEAFIKRSIELRESLRGKVEEAGGKADFAHPLAYFQAVGELEGLIKQGEEIGSPWDSEGDEDIRSLQQVLLFGLKGIAAYAHHAALLGQEDDIVYAFLHEALSSLAGGNLTLDEWIKLVLKCGEVNLRAMELLDAGNTGSFGHPVPTKVPLGHKKGKCILVSGHDLKDLQTILEQTKGKGIYVYTHGEMLPAHGYPELKKYEHFYGHFGTAWQNQKKEFPQFPGLFL